MRYAGVLLLLCAAGCAPVERDAVTVEPKPIMVWNDLLSRAKPAPDATVSYGADDLQVVDV